MKTFMMAPLTPANVSLAIGVGLVTAGETDGGCTGFPRHTDSIRARFNAGIVPRDRAVANAANILDAGDATDDVDVPGPNGYPLDVMRQTVFEENVSVLKIAKIVRAGANGVVSARTAVRVPRAHVHAARATATHRAFQNLEHATSADSHY
jgi:hypothetical protein